MSYLLNSQELHINSNFRESGNSSNFMQKFDIQGNYEYCCLKDCAIPKSYNNVQSPYNTFKLIQDTKEYILTVTPQCYSEKLFKTTIQSLLNTNTEGYVYTVTFDAPKGKYIFSVTNATHQPVITFPEDSALYERFGFNANSTNTFVTNTLTSVNAINMQLENTIFLCTDMITNKNNGNNILQCIYANSSSDFKFLVYECKDIQANSKPFVGNNTTAFNFFVTDENGYPINLNGLNIVGTILLWNKDRELENIQKKLLAIEMAKLNMQKN